MTIKSLDPRITRLNIPEQADNAQPKKELDQFGTYQVFLLKKEGKPFEHAGIVHAPTPEMAFVFAKEQYSRRFTCYGMMVVDTADVKTTSYTEGDVSVYSEISEPANTSDKKEIYAIFQLKKRGKQHEHAGNVEASSYEEAAWQAKQHLNEGKTILNLWIVKIADMLLSDEEDKDIWETLNDNFKAYRDAAAYKATDKLKAFKEANKVT